MDGRASIKAVLSGEPAERVPRALFGAGRWLYRQQGLHAHRMAGDPEGFADALADFLGDLDTDIVFPGSGLNTFPAEAVGGELVFREGQAPLLSAPVIEKTRDARFLSDITIADSPQCLALVAMTRRLRERLPDRFLCATSWGPFTWGMILCDWNLLREKAATDREFISEVCGLGVRLSAAYFSLLIDHELVDGICISDGAATLAPAELYIDTILPAERQLFDHFRGRGIARFLHQCGTIAGQVPYYPDTGADCITLDAGIDLGDVYRLYDGKVVTAGNVDVIKTVFGGDEVQICDAVSACLAAIPRPVRKFILMPSCDLPPDTPLQNARAFLACADRLS
jgi:uroporphyrinogen decarboxylase